MFDRFTDKARRVVLRARREAARSGSDTIEPHHLLLALIREDPVLARRVLKSHEALQAIRTRFESADLEFSLADPSKQALAQAAEEAEQMKHRTIGTEHLLLGLLRGSTSAAEALREHGLQVPELRELVALSYQQRARITKEELHQLVDELPESRWDSAGRILADFQEDVAAPLRTSIVGGSIYSGSYARYNEKVRRVLFFARYEASQLNSASIETEHILLGLFREDNLLVHRFVGPPDVIEKIRREIENRTPIHEPISSSYDLPLSEQAQRAMAFSVEESERRKQKHVGTEHVLMGLLREEQGLAAELLRAHGVDLAKLLEAFPGP